MQCSTTMMKLSPNIVETSRSVDDSVDDSDLPDSVICLKDVRVSDELKLVSKSEMSIPRYSPESGSSTEISKSAKGPVDD